MSMPASPSFPENVAEVASIHVAVGMSETGTGCSYSLEGLSHEAAIGYLTTVVDQLREEVRMRWAGMNEEEFFIRSIDVECPECGEHIHIETTDEDDDDEELEL